ncbi:MAG: DUF6089 family protein [Bacteroidetes bacterium]|nr:DUF6089 family protein [Bacteroidota bacterium]
MRKLVVLLLLSSYSVISYSQYLWDFGAHAGASNYLGEMGGKANTRRDFIADMKLSKTQFAVGGFARYKFNPIVSAKLGLDWNRIAGADYLSTNPGRAGRNLSFRDDIIDLELTGQFFFVDVPDLGRTYRYRNDFRMYAFVGVGAFYYNPKTYYNGSWVALRPLQTEGKKYSAVSASIPLGIGMYFTIDKKHRIGWEFNWRTTFTDYLDDVSTVYADPADLTSAEAIALANRRGELGNASGIPNKDNYLPGMKRGDPSHNDSYMTTSINYSYIIRGRSSFYRSKYGSIFKHKKYKKRKIRAKF